MRIPTLRAATPADIEAIANLWHRGWRDGHLGHVPESLHRHRQLGDFRARVPSRWLAVVEGNARARRFYARHGWGDAGAFDYAAEITNGTLAVPCRRYLKRLARGQAR